MEAAFTNWVPRAIVAERYLSKIDFAAASEEALLLLLLLKLLLEYGMDEEEEEEEVLNALLSWMNGADDADAEELA